MARRLRPLEALRHPAREAYSYRNDPAVPDFPDGRPIIIFDGECVFCSRFAQFILEHDRKRIFRLMAAQTPLGAALYTHYGLDPVGYETHILIEDGHTWLKSEGSIKMFERLGPPWSAVAVFRLLPPPLRDRLYMILARNRLRWFGIRKKCFVPEPEDADRFLA